MTAWLSALLILFAGYNKNEHAAQRPEPAHEESGQVAASTDSSQQAEPMIRQLPPSAFPDLPAKLRKRLQDRSCTIPQVFGISEPHNVIRGQFTRKGQTDWAVLCSKDGKSSILVFWGKPTRCPSELALAEDNGFLQPGYSRQIVMVDKDYIIDHYKSYGGPVPPPLDHQGINDAFVEKASEVHYCYQGKWLRLTGAD